MAQKSAEKWKSKKWFEVFAPKILGEESIGEMPADDDSKIMGRIIKVSMSWITHKPEHSFLVVGLRVNNINGNRANTELDSLELTFSYTHSLVKRRSSVIYTVDNVKAKDGRDFTLKLMVVTSNKVATPKKGDIRTQLSGFTREYAAAHTLEEFMNAVLSNEFQMESVKRIMNIAQINRMEVRKVEL